MQDFYIKSDKVSRYSVLTLIYRAIPPPPGSSSAFIPDCIDSARAALEAHQVCMTKLKESNEVLKCSYMHWYVSYFYLSLSWSLVFKTRKKLITNRTILYAPFVPFIVLICHILEVPVLPPTSTSATPTTNPDLTRLTDFVLSLRPLCAHSEAIANLHRLCQVLCSVARLYVEAKAKAKANAQAQQTGGGAGSAGGDIGGSANAAAASAQNESESESQVLASVGMEFDTYLSALGLAPPPQQQQQAMPSSSFGVVGGADGTGAGPWNTGTVAGAGAGGYAAAAAPDTAMGSGPGPDEGMEASTNPIDVSQSQTAQLGNWFSGNQYMMGLLEEDLSLIDPSAWP